MAMPKSTATRNLRREVTLVTVSIVAAFAAQQLGYLERALDWLEPWHPLASLAAGVFYSSIFTVAPATITFGELATRLPAWQVALLGGAGAMAGDLLIFRFLRSTLAAQLQRWAASRRRPRWRRLLHPRHDWPLLITGALIIASPLPDEIGLALMGFTQVRAWRLALLSFLLNSCGIFVIGLIAQATSQQI